MAGYWTDEDYQRRQAEKRASAQKLAAQQNESNAAPWKALGGAIQGGMGMLGDFGQTLNQNNQRFSRGLHEGIAAIPSLFGGNRQESRPQSASPASPSVSKYSTDDARDKAMAGRQGMGPNSMPPADTSEEDFFSDLLAKGTAKWGGLDRSQVDYSPLDKALESRLNILNELRGQTQGNFDKSDANLESMHRGFQNHIQTDGAQRFNNIADTEKSNLQGIQQQGQQNLQGIKDSDMAKRQAMLKALGIEASGATADSSADPLTQTQGSLASRSNAELVNAEGDRASNLAYNQSVATSVGQQGVERRSELSQQLQQILGKIGMAESDSRMQNADQRMQLDNRAEDRQYSEFTDERGYFRDTARQMQQDAAAEREAMLKGGDTKTAGYSGLARDLMNTGYQPDQIQGAMGALSQVLGSEYLKGINPNEGYSQTAVINRLLQKDYGIDPDLAIQLATNYGNLGTNNSY